MNNKKFFLMQKIVCMGLLILGASKSHAETQSILKNIEEVVVLNQRNVVNKRCTDSHSTNKTLYSAEMMQVQFSDGHIMPIFPLHIEEENCNFYGYPRLCQRRIVFFDLSDQTYKDRTLVKMQETPSQREKIFWKAPEGVGYEVKGVSTVSTSINTSDEFCPSIIKKDVPTLNRCEFKSEWCKAMSCMGFYFIKSRPNETFRIWDYSREPKLALKACEEAALRLETSSSSGVSYSPKSAPSNTSSNNLRAVRSAQ
jgi:hypothetical protein